MEGSPSAEHGCWSWHRVPLSSFGSASLRVRIFCDDSSEPVLKNLNDLAATLSSHSVRQVEMSCGRDDLEEVSQQTWLHTFVEAIQEAHSIERLRFTVPYCRPGLKDNKLVTLLPKLTGLRDLEIYDGLYAHTDTFAKALPKLKGLERLVLVDTSHHTHISDGCAPALTAAVLSLPRLRVVRMNRARFERQSDLELFLDSLVSKVELEEIEVCGLDVAGCPLVNLEPYIALFAEQTALQTYRKANNLTVESYCMSSYLRAFLQVRSWKLKDPSAATTTTKAGFTTLGALPLVADNLDCLYQLLRYEVDPAHWSH